MIPHQPPNTLHPSCCSPQAPISTLTYSPFLVLLCTCFLTNLNLLPTTDVVHLLPHQAHLLPINYVILHLLLHLPPPTPYLSCCFPPAHLSHYTPQTPHVVHLLSHQPDLLPTSNVVLHQVPHQPPTYSPLLKLFSSVNLLPHLPHLFSTPHVFHLVPHQPTPTARPSCRYINLTNSVAPTNGSPPAPSPTPTYSPPVRLFFTCTLTNPHLLPTPRVILMSPPDPSSTPPLLAPHPSCCSLPVPSPNTTYSELLLLFSTTSITNPHLHRNTKCHHL